MDNRHAGDGKVLYHYRYAIWQAHGKAHLDGDGCDGEEVVCCNYDAPVVLEWNDSDVLDLARKRRIIEVKVRPRIHAELDVFRLIGQTAVFFKHHQGMLALNDAAVDANGDSYRDNQMWSCVAG